ncbi:MAG: beta-lactamase family protein [Bryobacterales bacterium]|nr:beta-lactamase family protein [Bryobacterales bacterium]
MFGNIFLRLLAAALLAPPLTAQPQPWAGRLDDIGQTEQQRQKLPGLVLVVVKGQSVAYAKGFGLANVETKEPVTPDHLFRVGSTTKMIVGASLASLAHQDKLPMNAPIETWLAEHRATPLGKLTAHQLLTHTAGLMDRTLMYGRHDDSALADNVRSLQPDVLFTSPGEIYSYSNLGFAIAGRLLESVTARPFADAVADLVFQPLGMKRTTFRPTLAMTYPLAQGHIRENGALTIARPAADHSGYWPAGSMFTSGNDFARFAMALLNHGRAGDNAALPAPVIAMVTSPHVPVPGGGRYGYGIGVTQRDGKTVLSHSGGRQGYSTFLLAVPQDATAVLALINQSGADAATPAYRAFQAVAGWDARTLPTSTPTKLTPAEISGFYTHYTSTAGISNEGGKLLLRFDNASARELVADTGNCYRAAADRVCFETGPDGRARYLLRGSRAFARRN